MAAKLALAVTFAALLVAGNFAQEKRAGRVLDDGYHHLGNDETKDWKEASPKPEGKRLDVRFDSKANAGEWTLFLEQRSIDNAWRVKLNDVEFTLLRPVPELVPRHYSIPAGRVKEGANVLSFVPDQPNDDVVIGKLRLVEASLREMFDTQRVELTVSDAQGDAALPARVTFVDAKGALAPIYYGETPGTAVRDGVIYVSNHAATLELPAGEYMSYATRGPEWSCSTVSVSVKAGVPTRVAHRLRRELDTTGFVAADTHLHTLQFSGHGDADALERQVTLAGEGVEFAVATDHNHNTDYQPFQKTLGLTPYYTSVVGNEVTTEVGHFNGFPLQVGDPVPAHDSKDFVAIVDGIRARGAKVVILNHPRWPTHEDSPFTNNKLDRDTGAFATDLKLTMDATELINSTTSEADPLFVFHDWFALLNRGVRIFAVGSSDSHTVGDVVGQGRTYVPSVSDDPTKIDVDAVCDAIKNGHTSIGQGMFVTVLVNGKARMGDTLTITDGSDPSGGTDLGVVPKVHVELRVQAPSWIVPRKATLFVNGAAVEERALKGVAGKPTDTHLEFELVCDGHYDRWIVCVVTGDAPQGLSWPTTNPYTVAATNPVFLDTDALGHPGWQSPRETAANWVMRSERQPAELLGAVIQGVDEAISVHVLDLFAEKLRAAGTDPAEVRKQILELASHANPAFEGVRRFCARL